MNLISKTPPTIRVQTQPFSQRFLVNTLAYSTINSTHTHTHGLPFSGQFPDRGMDGDAQCQEVGSFFFAGQAWARVVNYHTSLGNGMTVSYHKPG